jgi:heat shock protein HslJ
VRREGNLVQDKERKGIIIALALALVILLVGCGSPEQTPTPAPETFPTAGPVGLDGSEWTLTTLKGADLLPGTHITLGFAEEQASGFAGCNAYGGPYSTGDDGTLSVSMPEMTAQACLEPQGVMEQEQAYLAALRDAAAYRRAGDRLDLVGAEGESLLIFARKERFAMDPGALPDTKWQLVSFDGASPVEGSRITLAFRDLSHVSGQAGCREYTATYEASGDRIRFPFLSMSGDDACLADEALYRQEGQYTDALSWATNYLLDEGRLEIQTARGEVLIFEPPSVEPAVRPEHAGPGFPPTDYGCTSPFSMVWSSHRLEGLTLQVQEALEAAGIRGAKATAEAYGEDWFEQSDEGGTPALCNFSVMETDFTVLLPVESLMNPDGLGARLSEVLAVLDRFPPEDTPGQQAGRVSVAFVSPDKEEGWLWFSVTEGVQARQNGLTGGALVEALRYQHGVGPRAEAEADAPSQAPASGLDACEPYLELAVSYAVGEDRAAVTSYQCGTAHVDSTGQSPSSLSGAIPAGTPLELRLSGEKPPERVEVRIYPGTGISASFFMWPEDLPTGAEPVARFEQVPGPDFSFTPQIPPGEYSVVIRAVWEGGVEVFYAFSLTTE